MPRPLRIRVTGVSQHLIQRGNDRMDIFRCDSDYLVFLAMLRDGSSRYGLPIHGYVAMKNHFHVLATPTQLTTTEQTMQMVGARYARYFNKRYRRTGALFEGRYRSTFVDDERYWITCLRYIELNPVRAGIVASPDEYRWSSFRANAFGSTDRLLSPHPRYLELGMNTEARQQVWKTLCAASLTADELNRIRFAAYENRVLGVASAAAAHAES